MVETNSFMVILEEWWPLLVCLAVIAFVATKEYGYRKKKKLALSKTEAEAVTVVNKPVTETATVVTDVTFTSEIEEEPMRDFKKHFENPNEDFSEEPITPHQPVVRETDMLDDLQAVGEALRKKDLELKQKIDEKISDLEKTFNEVDNQRLKIEEYGKNLVELSEGNAEKLKVLTDVLHGLHQIGGKPKTSRPKNVVDKQPPLDVVSSPPKRR